MFKNFYPLMAIFLLPLSGNGQGVDLYEAVTLSLKHNYDVIIAGVDRSIAENNAERGNAGLLPSVYLDGAGNYAKQSAELQFASPEQPPINADNAQTITYNAGAYLDYTLFNGGRRIYTLNYLGSLSEDARLREKLSMENTTLTVSNQFLEVVRLIESVAVAEEAVELSQQRLTRASENYNYGNSTKLQLLNAEVDLRNDSLALAQQSLDLSRGRRNLNMAIGIPADTVFQINTGFEFMAALDKSGLLEKALSQNTDYIRARNTALGAEFQLKTVRADQYPTLNLQGAYKYSFSDQEASFITRQVNYGWNAGLGLRFYIFDGSRIRRAIDNATLSSMQAEVEVARSLNEMNRLIGNAYDTYITSFTLLNISLRNLELAELNYSRSNDAFATGQITGVELRDAQLNLSNARNTIAEQRVRTKLAEINLLYESGTLLEN